LIHFYYYDIDARELYDLQKDANEVNNVVNNPAYAEVVKQLKAKLNRLRKQYGDSDELTKKFLQKHSRRDTPANLQINGQKIDELVEAGANRRLAGCSLVRAEPAGARRNSVRNMTSAPNVTFSQVHL